MKISLEITIALVQVTLETGDQVHQLIILVTTIPQYMTGTHLGALVTVAQLITLETITVIKNTTFQANYLAWKKRKLNEEK